MLRATCFRGLALLQSRERGMSALPLRDAAVFVEACGDGIGETCSAASVLNDKTGGHLGRAWRLTRPAVAEGEAPAAGQKDASALVVTPAGYGEGVPERVALVSPAAVLSADPEGGEGELEEGLLERARQRELSRRGAAIAVKMLKSCGAQRLHLVGFPDLRAAREGAELALHEYPTKQLAPPRLPTEAAVAVEMDPGRAGEEAAERQWREGGVIAACQNWARALAGAPANMLTPVAFCEAVEERLVGLEGVEVRVRDEAWLLEAGMGGLLGVSRGSVEAARMMEVEYRGPGWEECQGAGEERKPLVFVGKGVTFDSGGISIKGAGGMDSMKADMSGAAVVAAVLEGVARLRLPLRVVGLMPLAENMPSGSAVKPGDILRLHGGQTVEVLNTDAEGRLLLADALSYACATFRPHTLLDVATLTGAIGVALGDVYAGVFCNSADLWRQLNTAGVLTGERFWRMPLDRQYREATKGEGVSHFKNIPKPNKGGGACTAAGFLQHFAKCDRWAHIDIAGVMENSGSVPYEPKGMAGKPVRALLEFAIRSASKKR